MAGLAVVLAVSAAILNRFGRSGTEVATAAADSTALQQPPATDSTPAASTTRDSAVAVARAVAADTPPRKAPATVAAQPAPLPRAAPVEARADRPAVVALAPPAAVKPAEPAPAPRPAPAAGRESTSAPVPEPKPAATATKETPSVFARTEAFFERMSRKIASYKPSSPSASTDEGSKTRWTTDWLNVRRKPSDNAKIVKVLKPGTQVQAVQHRWGWWLVLEKGDSVGFVTGTYLTSKPPQEVARRQ